MPRSLLSCLLIAGASMAAPAHAADIHVAVASNFAAPMEVLAQQFQKKTGHKLLLSFGATGKLYAQISNGAPFEVFLSADDETPVRLITEKRAYSDSRFTYAIGKLVLWSAQADYVDANGAVLERADLAKLAVANPDSAPYGKAAIETLTALGLHDRLKPKLVFGENIGQAYQFAASGNAQAGFVALSQILVKGKPASGSAWIVPPRLYTPLRQDAVLLGQGAKPGAPALALLAYLKSEPARQLIRAYGYGLAD